MPSRFSQWLKEATRRHRRVERIGSAFAALPGRERPRDTEVEEFLRERGAPDELLDPERVAPRS